MVRAARASPPPFTPLAASHTNEKNTTTKKSTIDTHNKGPVEGREPPDSRVRHKPDSNCCRLRVRYVWLLQRWLLVRKVKGVVTLYSRFRMYGTPEVHRIEAGAPLPLVCNPTEDKTIDEVYAASCKVGEALAVVQSRAQALVFEVNCDMERATEYVAELWNSGWGDLQPVTELPRRGKDRIRAVISK